MADILVAAIGRPAFVTPAFVKPGATVIDVGTNALTDRDQVAEIFGVGSKKMVAFDKRGRVLSGDVHPAVASVAGAPHAGPRRGRAADDRHAPVQHGHRGRGTTGRSLTAQAGRVRQPRTPAAGAACIAPISRVVRPRS